MLSAGWGSQLSLKRERLSNPGGLITRRAVSICLRHMAVCSNQPPAIFKNIFVFGYSIACKREALLLDSSK